jgi:hypothetical protein
MRTINNLRRSILWCLLSAIGTVVPTHLFPAAFQNLNFEAATVSPLPPGQGEFVSITTGLPGWRGLLRDTEQTMILHNSFSLGSSALAIHGPQSSSILEGNYTVWLMAGVLDGSAADATLSQIGTVPVNAESLKFRAVLGNPLLNPVPLDVTLGGQALPRYLLENDSVSPIYAVDVSGFKGSTVELTFNLRSTVGMGLNFAALDSIVFSSESVPEPAAIWLLASGLAAVGLCRRRRRTR